MEGTLILFFATLMVFGTSGVQAEFSFSNATVNITRTGCGSTKLCVQSPDACDPAGTSNCLFGSSALKNGTANDFSFQLSGIVTPSTTNQTTATPTTANATNANATTVTTTTTKATTVTTTTANATNVNATTANATNVNATTANAATANPTTTGGNPTFVALILTPTSNTNSSLIFACIQNISTFSFKTYTNSSGNVIEFNKNVSEIRGLVNNTKIQCEFDVANVTTSSLLRSQDNVFNITLASGTLTEGRLALTDTFNGGVLDLANPTANVANTTNVPNTTVSGTNRALHSEGVLLLTGILSLVFLKTA